MWRLLLLALFVLVLACDKRTPTDVNPTASFVGDTPTVAVTRIIQYTASPATPTPTVTPTPTPVLTPVPTWAPVYVPIEPTPTVTPTPIPAPPADPATVAASWWAAEGYVVKPMNVVFGPCPFFSGVVACWDGDHTIYIVLTNYDLTSIIAHEMGHSVGFDHFEPTYPIMNPDNWGGPSTRWCSVSYRCQ